MNEIEKMYENAGIEKVKNYYCPNCETKLEDWFGKHKEYICPNVRCEYALCDDEEDFQECLEHLSYREKYPPFTVEKQIELIKLLGNVRDYTVEIDKFKGVYYVGCRSAGSNDKLWGSSNVFEDALAELINETWFLLSEEEKQQVKGILE